MPFLKIVEEFLYRRTEHTTGHQVHDDLDWNLWISRELVPDVLNTAFDKPLYSLIALLRKFVNTDFAILYSILS